MEGFRHKRKCKDLLGCEVSDWRSFVELYAPDIKNLREVVCLGNRYIVSLGAHSHHRFLLMDRAHADPVEGIDVLLECDAFGASSWSYTQLLAGSGSGDGTKTPTRQILDGIFDQPRLLFCTVLHVNRDAITILISIYFG